MNLQDRSRWRDQACESSSSGLSALTLATALLTATISMLGVKSQKKHAGAESPAKNISATTQFRPSLTQTNMPMVGEALVLSWFDGWGGKTLLRTNGPISGHLFAEWSAWRSSHPDAAPREVLESCLSLITKHWGEYNRTISASIQAARAAAEQAAPKAATLESVFPPALTPFAEGLAYPPAHQLTVPPHPAQTPWLNRPLRELLMSTEEVDAQHSSNLMSLIVEFKNQVDAERAGNLSALSNHMVSHGFSKITPEAVEQFARLHLDARQALSKLEEALEKARAAKIPGEAEIVDLDAVGRDRLICRGFAPEAHFMLSQTPINSWLAVGEYRADPASSVAADGHAFLLIPSMRVVFDPSGSNPAEALLPITSVVQSPNDKRLTISVKIKTGSATLPHSTPQYTVHEAMQIRNGNELRIVPLDVLKKELAPTHPRAGNSQ